MAETSGTAPSNCAAPTCDSSIRGRGRPTTAGTLCNILCISASADSRRAGRIPVRLVFLQVIVGNAGMRGICGVGLLPQDRAMQGALKSRCLRGCQSGRDRQPRPRDRFSSRLSVCSRRPGSGACEDGGLPVPGSVSLTITEGGYRVNRWTGAFEDWHADMQRGRRPPAGSMFSYLVNAGPPPQSVGFRRSRCCLCDNLQRNGDVARKSGVTRRRGKRSTSGAAPPTCVFHSGSVRDRL